MTGQSPDQSSEMHLVAQAQAGQLSAFEKLTSAYQDRLYNLSYRLSGSHDDAAELVQETCLRAMKGLAGFQKKAGFYTWLVRILLNLVNDVRQRHQRHAQLFSGSNPQILQQTQAARLATTDNPAAVLERRETADLVAHALQQLDATQRQALVLRDIEQLSYRQIGELLKLPEGTVKSRISRAREHLRESLAPYFRNA